MPMLPAFDVEAPTEPADDTMPDSSDIYIVANRLPFEYHATKGWRRSPGGLVSALEPVLQKQGARWVGWRGSPVPEENLGESSTHLPQSGNISILEVHVTQSEEREFYDGVCNATFWPLYHGNTLAPVFCDEEFEVYRRINQRFADCVAQNAPSGALVWVNDYQLQLVPALLREVRPDLRIGFFLHVPFPSPAKFFTLPWQDSILDGLLGASLVGFQTASCAEHFIEAVCRRLPVTREERGIVLQEATGSRHVTVDVFPIGPDSERFCGLAASSVVREAAATLRANLGKPELILLGIDRLDYTKGIEQRIRAVTDILKSVEFRGRDIQFIQVAVPSRSKLKAYQELRIKVEETLQLSNEKLLALGLRPIHYIYETLQIEQVVALYLSADIMLVTSLADGMNLVSKEYVLCHADGTGRLVLSRMAGAALQLCDAWLVDPSDFDELKRVIAEAIHAGSDEAHERMDRLHRDVLNADARHWAQSFLTRLREA
jgi:alpha,alpha-trehalose-phosphate synthase [UDP-forming]